MITRPFPEFLIVEDKRHVKVIQNVYPFYIRPLTFLKTEEVVDILGLVTIGLTLYIR